MFRFHSNAEVTLKAPAKFGLNDARRAFLHHGELTAFCPPEARGFTIGAPGCAVIDLGTRFWMKVDKLGFTDVTVQEGKVDLRRDNGEVVSLMRGAKARAPHDVALLLTIDRPEITHLPNTPDDPEPRAPVAPRAGDGAGIVPGNLIADPGFESGVRPGDPGSPWQAPTLPADNPENAPAVTIDGFEKNAVPPYSGQYVLNFRYPQRMPRIFYTWQAFDTTPGASYEVRLVYARYTGKDFPATLDTAALEIDVFDGDTDPGGAGYAGDLLDDRVLLLDIPTDGWVKFRATFTAASQRTTLRLRELDTTRDDITVDDVIVVETAPPTPSQPIEDRLKRIQPNNVDAPR